MRHTIRVLLTSLVVTAIAAPATHLLDAQLPSRHGQPKAAFGTADFAKLRWLEGDWAGTAPDERPVYARYTFTNDSTIDITYYRDESFSQPASTGRLYLSVGHVYQTYGPNRWGASRVGEDGLYFVPQASIRSYLEWRRVSPDAWTATQRSGVGGHEAVTVYQFRRVK